MNTKFSEADAKRAALIYDGEDVERCRQARRALEKRFKTLDAMLEFSEQIRKRHDIKKGKARVNRKTRPASADSKSAPRKTVHKI